MNKFNKLSPKTKQKLVGIFGIIFGIFASCVMMPDEYGWGILFIIIGIYLLFTKKQVTDFDF